MSQNAASFVFVCTAHLSAGVKLEPEQTQKIQAEAAVIAEIKELGGTV